MNLKDALSSGIANCVAPSIPEALVEIVEVMNIELGYLGVFSISKPQYLTSGIVYNVEWLVGDQLVGRMFIQLIQYYPDWKSFGGIPVDGTYESLYSALTDWLGKSTNILQLGLSKH